MITHILWFLVGFVLLIKGGDWFVDGASALARRFHIPELLIGATVVSIGTTLPEVMVSSGAAISGSGGIAYGNAIGSIICNTALISALTVAVRPSDVDRKTLLTPVAFFFAAAAFYCAIAYITQDFARWTGIALLTLFVIYMIFTVRQALTDRTPAPAQAESAEGSAMWKDLLCLAVGAVLIAVGADLLVDHGTAIAEKLGVPDSVIGLTFVALGTSLPELVTAITALVKGHSALSLGNIIGANLFNLVLVSGLSITLSPFTLAEAQGKSFAGYNASLLIDIPVMFAVMLLLTVPALIRGKLSRWQGVLMLCIYAGFCAFQFFL